MPLTQSRMKEVLDAAAIFETRLRELYRQAEILIDSGTYHTFPPEVQSFLTLITESPLPTWASAIIAREQEHYRLTASRNARGRRSLANRRLHTAIANLDFERDEGATSDR